MINSLQPDWSPRSIPPADVTPSGIGLISYSRIPSPLKSHVSLDEPGRYCKLPPDAGLRTLTVTDDDTEPALSAHTVTGIVCDVDTPEGRAAFTLTFSANVWTWVFWIST